MSVALSQSILKCVSTDTIREVTRKNTPAKPPELMRSSYEGEGDPVMNWKECCKIIDPGIDALVDDAMKRGTSLVLEGVHIQPNNDLLDRWRSNGGSALGCLLMIKDAEAHKSLIFKRGEVTKKGEEKKINAFDRIRKIQDAMFKMAVANDWLLIEQKIEPDPLEIVNSLLDD
jgi:2-phosphoglycerate kinase